MRETMKVVFIVGPNKKSKNMRDYKRILAKNSVGVYSFYDLTRDLGVVPIEYIKHLCILFLRTTASAILALPGWEENEVVKEAVLYAKHYNTDIFYPQNPNINDKELVRAIIWGRAPWLMTLKK